MPIQLVLGEWTVMRGNRADARAAYEAARTLDPTRTEADLALAELDLVDGHADAARQRLTGLLPRDPKNPKVHLKLAELDDKAGNAAGAIEHLKAVVAAQPKNVVALNNLAYLLEKTDPDGALTFAEQAVQLSPQNASFEDTLGSVYYRKGLYGLAITHLKIAEGKDPTPRHEFHLGMAYKKFSDPALGTQMVASALKKDPSLAQTEKEW